jgi:hypothetical protein
MDRSWAIERLENWVKLADEYKPFQNQSGPQKQKAAQALLAATPQAEQIVSQRYRLDNGLVKQLRDWDHLLIEHGQGIARQAIGLLRTEEETAERLGPAGPKMRADDLHTVVWNAAAKLWSDGHYTEAVKRAATFLNAHVAARLDRHDVSDASLMREAFSSNPPEAGRTRLRWPGDASDLTVKSMNDGLRNYAVGVFMAIRNVTTHDTNDLEPQLALEQLAALSLLARWIDVCVEDRA